MVVTPGYYVGVMLFIIFVTACMIYVGILIGINHMKDDALDKLIADNEKLTNDFALLVTVLGVRSEEDEG